MKRKIVLCCICFGLLFSGTITATAPPKNSTLHDVATALSQLKLFQGTDRGFDLEDPPQRIQGLIMLIRLTGNEEAAEASAESHPFTDVAPWAAPSVAFAYKQKWVAGYGDGRFGGEETLTEQQYLALILRALGYSEDSGDFSWETVEDLAANLGLRTDLGQDVVLNRGHMVLLSWEALQQKLKASEETLADVLVKKQVFDGEKYKKIKSEIVRPEIIMGFLNKQDLQQIATAYGKSVEQVQELFAELLHQAKEVTPQKGIEAWVLQQIKEIKAELSVPPAQTYDQMVQELWKDFWNEVDGKLKPE